MKGDMGDIPGVCIASESIGLKGGSKTSGPVLGANAVATLWMHSPGRNGPKV
jgi:hypothetical protein